METSEIISAIDAEIAKLRQARAILSTLPGSLGKRGPGRPKASGSAVPIRKQRTLTAEGRARIAEGQKKRWAARNKKN